LRRSGDDNKDSDAADDDDESAASGNIAVERALVKSPRFTASQATSRAQREAEAGIIEEIQMMNFMNHSKLSFQ